MSATPHRKETAEIEEAPEFPGAPLSGNSKFYVERPPIEVNAYTEIAKPGSILRIKGSKKTGKNSLMLRIIERAAALGYQTAIVDFQQAEEAIFADIEKFLRWFSSNIARQIKLEPHLDDWWDEDIGSKVSCTVYFEGYLLEKIESPIVVILNEVSHVFKYANIAREFLPLLRLWHEQARQIEVWQKLRLVVFHSTEVYVSLSIDQSPFNVGRSLKLPEFSFEQVQDLASRYKLNSLDSASIQRLMKMVGGHPYLIQLAFYHLWEQNISLEQLLEQAPTCAGIYGNYLQGHWAKVQKQPELAAALERVIGTSGSVRIEPTIAYQLDSMGLVKLDGNACTVACELHRLYFGAQNLSEESLKAFSVERLKQENQRLQALVNIDELTQVANRRYFNSYLLAEWGRMAREKAPLSLILCDIDYFKIYNDAYGHQAGDDCLQKVAEAIRQMLERLASFPRENPGMVARYGGEEFAVVLPRTDATVAFQVAEMLRSSVEAIAIAFDSPKVGGLPYEVVTISAGVASTIPNELNDLGTLFFAADRALYESKRRGRNCSTLSSILNFSH